MLNNVEFGQIMSNFIEIYTIMLNNLKILVVDGNLESLKFDFVVTLHWFGWKSVVNKYCKNHILIQP